MQFRLAKVVGSNPFNFVIAHCYERASRVFLCKEFAFIKINWITAHNYG